MNLKQTQGIQSLLILLTSCRNRETHLIAVHNSFQSSQAIFLQLLIASVNQSDQNTHSAAFADLSPIFPIGGQILQRSGNFLRRKWEQMRAKMSRMWPEWEQNGSRMGVEWEQKRALYVSIKVGRKAEMKSNKIWENNVIQTRLIQRMTKWAQSTWGKRVNDKKGNKVNKTCCSLTLTSGISFSNSWMPPALAMMVRFSSLLHATFRTMQITYWRRRLSERQTNTPPEDRQTDRQTTVKQTHRHTDTQTQTHRHITDRSTEQTFNMCIEERVSRATNLGTAPISAIWHFTSALVASVCSRPARLFCTCLDSVAKKNSTNGRTPGEATSVNTDKCSSLSLSSLSLSPISLVSRICKRKYRP